MSSGAVAGAAFPSGAYRSHALHDPERAWPQTNCSVDLMIELVDKDGQDPRAMLAMTVAQDFEGDHFTFFKVPTEDIEALYGLTVLELAVWDDLESHLLTQVARGNIPLVEVDGFHLPDTRGVTYRELHGKTTIGIRSLDPAARRMEYFHNETFGTLEGEDYDGILQRLPYQQNQLLPYTELMKRIAGPAPDPRALAVQLLQKHLQRRPSRNPFVAYAEVFPAHLAAFGQREPEYFHAYAFNTVRQFGANFGLLASFLAYLGDAALEPAAEEAERIAQDAKVLQFRLARAANRKRFDALDGAIAPFIEAYDRLIAILAGAAASPAAA